MWGHENELLNTFLDSSCDFISFRGILLEFFRLGVKQVFDSVLSYFHLIFLPYFACWASLKVHTIVLLYS